MNLSRDEIRQKQEQLAALQEEQRILQQQLKANQFAAEYPVTIQWPSTIVKQRTDVELVQHRLLEAGILYEVPTTVGDVLQASTAFVEDMQRTGCYEAVHVELQPATRESTTDADHDDGNSGNITKRQNIKVTLQEKPWYRLHIGGGVKAFDETSAVSTDGFLPTAEFDASVGLRNLAGQLDQTTLNVTVDVKQQTPHWSVRHERPLYTTIPEVLSELVLEQPTGSQYSLMIQAALDTLNLEHTRGYREYQRFLSCRVANTHSVVHGEQYPGLWYAAEWKTLFRDLVPSRLELSPFHYQASPEVVSQTGPSVKHSVSAEIRLNGSLTDAPYQPTSGVDFHLQAEVATPPGDVGFVKANAGLALHMPLGRGVTFHHMINAGALRNLSFGGLCRPAGLSDRFYVSTLRGFSPAGIGPRAFLEPSKPPGDSLGGDSYYTWTGMLSAGPPSGIPILSNVMESTNMRWFGFVTAGTCTAGSPGWQKFVQSSRTSCGLGLATTAMGPRLETTYSIPLRFGPADMRKQWQFHIGFSVH